MCDTTVILDASGSMAGLDFPPDRFLAARDAVHSFLEARVSAYPEDRASLVVFNQHARVLYRAIPICRALDAFYRTLSRVEPDGGTNIASGFIAAGSLMRHRSPNIQRRILLLTDGGDGRSSLSSATQLKEDGIIIDVIGIGGSPKDVDEPYLRQIASVINGTCRYRFIADRDRLLSHFATIARDLVHIGR